MKKENLDLSEYATDLDRMKNLADVIEGELELLEKYGLKLTLSKI